MKLLISRWLLLVYWLLAQSYKLHAQNNIQENLLLFNFDFENGTIEPWADISQDGTRWSISNASTFGNEVGSIHQPPPSANDGTNFLELKPTNIHTFGIGELKMTGILAKPGDQL